MRGTGDISDYAKARDTIRTPCKFGVVNLLNIASTMKQPDFDIIFCRNVFIYFNADQIKQITSEMLKHLNPHGILILAKSETLSGLRLAVTNLGPSIYGHEGAQKPGLAVAGQTPAAKAATGATKQGPIRVFCVDDSSTILNMLKRF